MMTHDNDDDNNIDAEDDDDNAKDADDADDDDDDDDDDENIAFFFRGNEWYKPSNCRNRFRDTRNTDLFNGHHFKTGQTMTNWVFSVPPPKFLCRPSNHMGQWVKIKAHRYPKIAGQWIFIPQSMVIIRWCPKL